MRSAEGRAAALVVAAFLLELRRDGDGRRLRHATFRFRGGAHGVPALAAVHAYLVEYR